MEPKSGKESVVARLFGFGRKKRDEEEPAGLEAEETGFARTEAAVDPDPSDGGDDGEEPRVTIPEQVIRVRSTRRSKDEVMGAISDSFRELTSLLGSVSDRLDRQDSRSSDLADQLRELPEYLRSLPRLQQEQNDALHDIGSQLASSNEILRAVGQEQTHAVREMAENMSQTREAVHGLAGTLARIPDELRARSEAAVAAQKEAFSEVADAQRQTAKVIYASQQKSLQLFHQATQKTLRQVEHSKAQMEELLDASVSNMKRMFVLAAAFMGAALIGVIGLLFFR